MFDFLKHNPAKKLNRNILILGLLIFIPVYTYIFQLFGKMGIEASEVNLVWLSFDTRTFEAFFMQVQRLGQLETFIWTFSLNIISMTGFMFTFFALTLILARQLPESSRLSKSAYVFPIISVAIAVLDIIPTIVFLMATSDLPELSNAVVYTISGGYVARVILLYIVLLWILLTTAILFLGKLRNRKT